MTDCTPTAVYDPVGQGEPSTSGHEREIRVLLVSHSSELRHYIQKGLSQGDFEFFVVTALPEAINVLSAVRGNERNFQALLLEMEDPMPEKEAEHLAHFCRDYPSIPVVGIAPKPSAELVRDSMILGVTDFLTNPFDRSGIVRTVQGVLEKSRASAAEKADEAARTENGDGKESTQKKQQSETGVEKLDSIITKNARMAQILDVVDRVAPTDSTVLVEGESGTGKELVARRLHHLSNRASGPFVEVHCGAIPETLLESQLFGHEKGSFTGAYSRQMGLFEIADKGTILLDEIAEMNLEMQVKLLRVLQERSFRRIGGRQTIHVDVRVVAATNRDLNAEVEAGRFRADLYYRINVISLNIPPVRERLEDVPDLVEFFVERLRDQRGLSPKKFHPDTVTKLQKMRWIGNVREIENAVERLVLLSSGDEISPRDVDDHISTGTEPVMDSPFAPSLTLDEVKKVHITNVLRANAGNKMKTARLLGINVKTLYNLIQKLEIPTA